MTTNTGQKAVLPLHIDVEADARVIKSVADETIQTILNKRTEMDRGGLQDEPLFVALGESHKMTAHRLHQLVVLDGLHRAGQSVATAFEYPHDQLLRDYEELAGYQRTPASDAALRQQDFKTVGSPSLQDNMAFYRSPQSDHADKMVMRYCRKTKTPSAFTDAAKLDGYLDTSDETTNDSIASCSGKIRSLFGISSIGVKGVHVRNHHMLTCARQAAEQFNSRIIVQQTGVAHVAGHRLGDDKACNSLLGLSRNFFAAALGFTPVGQRFSEGNLDRHALAKTGIDRDLYLCRRMPEITAIYYTSTDAPENDADLQSRKEEAAYINGVLQAIGLGHHTLSAESHARQRKLDEKAMHKRFAAIDRQTRVQPAAKLA